MKTKQTSLEAYKNIQPKIPNDHQVILSVLADGKEKTYKEIGRDIRVKLQLENRGLQAQHWIDPNKVSRRMLELVNLKKVEITGERICTIAKSRCTTYKLLADKKN